MNTKLDARGQKLLEFLKNPECVKKMDAIKSKEEAMALLKEYGVDITEEEFLGVLRAGIDKYEAIENKGKELTEADLKKVVGGVDYDYEYGRHFWSYIDSDDLPGPIYYEEMEHSWGFGDDTHSYSGHMKTWYMKIGDIVIYN